MLQQTQVARVIPAYQQFMVRFPNPGLFAAATPPERIEAWGDLGYLRRVRHLHAAATRIAAFGWPENLTDLSGVGPYTSAAVRAFADGVPVAAIDVNLRRVLSRWHGEVLSVGEAHGTGAATIDTTRPGDWNQAMMDLGATICRPRSPRCGGCAVTDWCADPTIIISAGRQSRFEGSVREARAAVLKHLAAGHRTSSSIVAATGLDPATLDEAIRALVSEAAVRRDGDVLTLQ